MSHTINLIDSNSYILPSPFLTVRKPLAAGSTARPIQPLQVNLSKPDWSFYIPPGYMNVCGTTVRRFEPEEPRQRELAFPPTPELDPYKDLNCSSHMRLYLTAESLRWKLGLAERALRVCSNKFDTIAFRGMSGAFLGPPLAMQLNKGMVLVRKGVDDSHANMSLEGVKHVSRYVIVDDFVSTMATVKNIIDTVYRKIGPEAVCIGILEVEYLDEKRVCAYEDDRKDILAYVDRITEHYDGLKLNGGIAEGNA